MCVWRKLAKPHCGFAGLEVGQLPQKGTPMLTHGSSFLEQMTGIEPAYSAWEADTLPLSYICKYKLPSFGMLIL